MPSRILIVDDDPLAREALAELLREDGNEVITAADGREALGLLGDFPPDIVLTDLSMPVLGGFAFVVELRDLLPEVPIMIVSAHAESQHRVHGLELGADDFVSKPVDYAELVGRINRHLARAQRQRKTLRESVSDELTGALNRRGIRNFFARAQSERVEGAAISLIIADIDKFKSINDRFGHAVGDLALCAVSRAFQDAIRATDRVGRLGGDEFVVVLPGMGADALEQSLERLRREQMPIELQLTGEDRLSVFCSIGGATASPSETFDEVVQRADRAMYTQKGRDIEGFDELAAEGSGSR